MRQTPRSINLYAVPSDFIPPSGTVEPERWSIPEGLLPCTVTRRDPDVNIPELMEWFKSNLHEVDGYLAASAALPALSLDKAMWDEATELLRTALAPYDEVKGAVFVAPLSASRSDKFAVADILGRLLLGNSLMPVVTYKQAVQETMVIKTQDVGTVESILGYECGLESEDGETSL